MNKGIVLSFIIHLLIVFGLFLSESHQTKKPAENQAQSLVYLTPVEELRGSPDKHPKMKQGASRASKVRVPRPSGEGPSVQGSLSNLGLPFFTSEPQTESENETSFLNEQGSPYGGFFDRYFVALGNHWHTSINEKLTNYYRKTGHYPKGTSHQVTVIMTLDPNGNIIKISIQDESGIHELNEAAVEAIAKIAQFPNPPRGLVSSNGVIDMPAVSFTLELH